MRISPRTLQTLRDRRLIGYSQINRRFYYKLELLDGYFEMIDQALAQVE